MLSGERRDNVGKVRPVGAQEVFSEVIETAAPVMYSNEFQGWAAGLRAESTFKTSCGFLCQFVSS